MKNLQAKRGIQLGVLLCLVLVVGGCGQRNFKEPIAKFQNSTTAATTAISSYYTKLNQYERDLYLEERLLNEKLEVLKVDQHGKPTPLFDPPFDPKSIQARLSLMRQIATYGERLSELAGNDAPERFKTNTKTLEESLNSLKSTFNELGNKPDDKEAKDYVGPIGNIAGIVGKALIERKREKALKEAIANGDKPVTEILNFLERDLKKYVELTLRAGHRQSAGEWVNYYNIHREAGFNISEQSVQGLKVDGVPGGVLEKLKGILNQDIGDEEAFVRLLKTTIGDKPTALYKSAILKSARHDAMSFEQRRQALEHIERTAAEEEIVTTSHPADVIKGMKTTHQALVKVSQEKRPVNLGSVLSALEQYENEVQELNDAVVKLRELRKGTEK